MTGKITLETVVIKELIHQIDRIYRTIAKGEGRCVEGYSMGDVMPRDWR